MADDLAIIVLTLIATAWWALFVRMVRKRERLVPSAVAWLALVYATWSTLALVQALLTEPGPREVVLRAILFTSLTIPSAWWVLTMRLAAPRGLRRWHLVATAIPIVAGALATALWPTGGPFLASVEPVVHGGGRLELAWTVGPAMRWVSLPYAYLLLTAALLGLLWLGFATPKVTRRTASLLAASLITPVTGTVLAVTGLDPVPGYGLTSFLLGPAVLVLFFVIIGDEAFDARVVAYGTVFRAIVEPALVVGPTGMIRDANPAARQLLGAEATRHGAPLRQASTALEAARQEMTSNSARRRLDGPLAGFDVAVTHLRDEQRTLLSSVLLLRDQRDQVAREAELRDAARRDPLTGIPNRLGFETMLRSALDTDPDGVGVAFIDLDDFKPVNDALGHAAGDAVLVEVGRRLEELVRGGDVAARLGGDEFGLLVRQATPADLETIADRVEASLTAPISVAGNEVRIGASIGLASAPLDGISLDALLSSADDRMYASKRGRRRAI